MKDNCKKWWDNSVFYQIYMPSFFDGNNDGIGDFKGIKEKIPYLKSLGIKGIWLTPFYKSPKVDNGYDIEDYYSIDESYGDMQDFEDFVKEAHKNNIKVIADIVINHTSNKHKWFIESRSSLDNPKRDFYIWKKGEKEPNNWQSFFGGSAWELDEHTNEYYYHSFAKEQVDLNWANDNVKKEIFKMLDFWLDKGIDGFRLDVINNLTLTDNFEDNPFDEKGEQIHKNDVNQDGILNIFKELREHTNKDREVFLVGEISSDNLELIHSYVGKDKLHTTFNFNLGSKEKFEINDFFDEILKMHKMYTEDKPTLFFGSHDMGRFASRFNFNKEEIKLLLTFMLTFKGIPFIYFGDEIGMQNFVCDKLEDARDVQGILAYKEAKEKGIDEKEAIKILNEKGRDKSRATMKWDTTSFGGFSKKEPWIPYIDNNSTSVKEQEKDEKSILSYVKQAIKIRNEEEGFSTGTCEDLRLYKGCILYKRKAFDKEYYILLNFSNEDISLEELSLNNKKVMLDTFLEEKDCLDIIKAKQGLILV